MTVPLPADNDTSWRDWAEAIHNAVNALAGGYTAPVGTTAATATQVVQTTKVTGDTTNRYERRANGSVAVGPGGTTPLAPDEAFYTIDMGADQTRHGLVVRCSSYDNVDGLSQGLVIFDHLGAPIFSVPKAGGPVVYGDNFRVFNGGEVFNHEISLRMDGTIQARRGDIAGGVGVFALGEAATVPTRAPDGSGDIAGSDTIAGNVMWVQNGRLFSRRSTGPVDVMGGSFQDFSPPASSRAGDFWFNAGNLALHYFNGTVWQRVAADIRSKRTITTGYTLVAADGYATVLHSTAAAAVTVTLPQDSAAAIVNEVAIPWRQWGAGQITFAAGTGATLVGRGGRLKSAGQYAEGTVTKVDANTWLVAGDTVA